MVSVEGLRRTGKYIRTIASRSVGIDQYQQYRQHAKAWKEIDHPDKDIVHIPGLMGTFGTTLAPATINLLAGGDEPSDSKIRSKFVAGVKSLSSFSIDLAPLFTPIAVEAATQNPLYFLGLLGKPLVNGVVWVASDMADARAFRKKDSPKANVGTYSLLEKIYDQSYDPKFKSGVVRNSEGKVAAIVRKEEVCARTGGSCMELILPKTEGEGRWIEFAHVTEKDVVVNTGSEKTPKAPPKIEELMEDLKKALNQTESPVLL